MKKIIKKCSGNLPKILIILLLVAFLSPLSALAVADNVAPALISVIIGSTGVNPNIAYNGDNIEVDFTANEPLSGTPSATILGHPATVISLGGNSYYAYSTATATDPLGPVSFTIDFTDLAGNPGAQVSSTTDGSFVILQLPSDTTAPIATGAWLTSNETDMTVAYPGTLIDLDFAINEQLKNLPIVTIFGRPADMVIDLGFNGFDYDYYAYSTATATDPLGPVSFTINFTDLAGNPGAQASTTTDGSFVILQLSETTAPIATGAWLTSNETDMAVAYPGTLIDLDFAINEQLKNLPIVTIFGRPADMVIDLGFNGFDYDYYAYSTATATDPLGPVSFTIDFTDLAGNHGTQTATTDGSLVTLYNPTHPVCQTGADINGNGSINITELLNYIADWKIGNVSLTLLLKAIGFWKIGTGC